mgnify:CR=1 FL=1
MDKDKDIREFADCYKRMRNLAFLRGVAYHEGLANPVANFTACFMKCAFGPMPGLEETA